MTRMGPALPKMALLLLTGIFGRANGVRWISMNGQNVTAYATSGEPVSIECTIAIPDDPGSFIFVYGQAIWRAVGVSAELSPSSPLWSVVLDRLNVPGYTPDPVRINTIFPVHTSAQYMRIGIRIQVPLPSDSGLYFCNGSYMPRSGGPTIVENSGQVYLSVTGTVPAATWITVNNWYWPSFKTGPYIPGTYQLQCNSYVTDSNSSITSQYILKTQSYLVDPLDGSSPYVYQTGPARMQDYGIPGRHPIFHIGMFGPTQSTPQQMTSGFNFAHHASNTGKYDCHMQYTARGNPYNYASATNFTVTIPDITVILAEVLAHDVLGNQERLSSYGVTEYSIYDEKFTMASVLLRLSLENEAPAFQLTVNDEDVTRSVIVTNMEPVVINVRNEYSKAFGYVNYRTHLEYKFPITSLCSWKVKCRSWAPSATNQISTGVYHLITKSCFEKTRNSRGSSLSNKASVTTVTPLKSGYVTWTVLIASLIQAFTA